MKDGDFGWRKIREIKMIPTFSQEVREAVTNATSGYCWRQGCTEKIHSIHHKLRNNAYNRSKFKLFTQSIHNAVGLCFAHHTNNAGEWNITEKIAEIYEEDLRMRSKEEK